MLTGLSIFWLFAALLLFRTVPRPCAFWITILGGWVILPPANYGPPLPPGVFPYWIIGSALPSEQLLTKLWIAPAIGLGASLVFDRARWNSLAWRWYDAPLAAFCLWPLGQGLWLGAGDPAPVTASLYLSAAWGLPWLAGKLYLRGGEDMRVFAGILALASLAMLPLALVEGVDRIRIHALLYGPHPFAEDGIDRYLGFRPQLFFEHGNQYGLWCAGSALAAAWRWSDARGGRPGKRWAAIAMALTAMTVASQSVGAIILLFLCLMFLMLPRLFALMRFAIPLGLAAVLALGALHISGKVPVRSLATETATGQALVGALRASGRGSAAWRVGQDLKALPLLRGSLVAGTARWNWFAPAHTRPWGLPLLILGQFGLVGAILLAGAFAAALLGRVEAARNGDMPGRLAILILLLFAADALFNSFIFYPAIAVAAGGGPLASRRARGGQE